DVAAGARGRIEKQDSAGFAAAVLPRVRDVARQERAGSRAADRHLITDLEGDLTLEHPGDLVAVTVEVEEALRTGRHRLLQHHDAVVGLLADQLQGREAAGRAHVEMLAAPGGYDHASCCAHHDLLSPGAWTSRSRWCTKRQRWPSRSSAS